MKLTETHLYINEESTKLSRNYESILDYNGAPCSEDDPADYFVYPKGVRLA